MAFLPQEPVVSEQETLKLEQTLYFPKMVSLDPALEAQIGTDEWYQFISSLESTVETLKNR